MAHPRASRSGPWSVWGLVGLPLGREVLRSTAATKLSSRWHLSFFYFFLKREDVPSPWSTTCFPLP
jgi:hypothetical protein